MSSPTYVIVLDDDWRFDPNDVFRLLRERHGEAVVQEPGDRLELVSDGLAEGWEVCVTPDLAAFVVKGSPTDAAELVTWVRGYVPSHVALEMFDEYVTDGPVPLLPGVTADYVGETIFGEDWTPHEQKLWEPPTLEERMNVRLPFHVRDALDKQRRSEDH